MTSSRLTELRAEVERIKQAGTDPANMARKRLIEIADELLADAEPVAAAVERHTEHMMYEAFRGALRIVQFRIVQPQEGQIFFDWLRQWKREQNKSDAEKARAVANFQRLVDTEKRL